MPPIRLDESDDDSELSDVDVAEIASVALSDTPGSTVIPTSTNLPEHNEMNRDESPLESQTIAASSNPDEDGGTIDLDTRPPPEDKADLGKSVKAESESPKQTRLPIQNSGRRGKKASTEQESGINPSEQPSNSLKRKSFPSDSPKNASTSPTAHRQLRRPDLATPTPRQPSIATSERQSTRHHESPSLAKIQEETARLREVLLHVSTEATQEILKEQWRNFLFTNAKESHITFILRAGLKNASPSVLARIYNDSGVMKDTFLETITSKQPIVARVLKSASANQLADLVPSKVLDQALSERLKSVPAKTLIRWLAEADRLGYSLDDILDENDETVVPNMPSRAQSHDGDDNNDDDDTEMIDDGQKKVEAPSLDPLVAEQERISALQKSQNDVQANPPRELRCPTCTYKFDTIRGHNFHRQKNICTRSQPPGLKFYCGNCAQGFTTKQGMLYHEKKRVCLGAEGSPDDETVYQDYRDIVSNSPNPQYGQHPDHPQNTSFGNIPRPPLHTPGSRSKHIEAIIAASPWDGEARHSPSELPPDKRAALEDALQKIEEKYLEDQSKIPEDWTAEKREARLTSLKNGNASRKSQIRKQFGVTLRMRDRDKEAKKIRDVLGSNSPMVPTGMNRIEYRNSPTVAGYPVNAQQQIHQNQTPAGMRMEMVDMRPATGFSPINAPPQHQQHQQHQQHPQHQQYSQVPPGHHPMQYPGPPQAQGFQQNFPPVPQLLSQPRPSPDHRMSPLGYQGAPEQAYRGPEDHANKRLKRNSSAGMSRADEERSRHFAPADSAPMGMNERRASGGRTQAYNGPGMVGMENHRSGSAGASGAVMEGESRPNSAGSSSVRKRVPVGALQRQWEALNGKGPGRKTELESRAGNVLMSGVDGGERANGRVENGNVVVSGKGKEPMREGGRNVVDLVSDDSSSEREAAGPGGGEK
ncbi:hypothetical protein BELL_0050g00010 [Botrytis elliptica]|uniref:Uncharacterized protein n=1 Tax=Botrytis elliptica TaxID=278938 RepID=A0A4Z1K4F7_9HELO|nr:hypothetical protein EAE99_003687 [Botrytis elliptica]TGO78890.1 hypothetical protein BELL_0050g00010 [Botrytis elliptica]